MAAVVFGHSHKPLAETQMVSSISRQNRPAALSSADHPSRDFMCRLTA
jgi:hypothetical protein